MAAPVKCPLCGGPLRGFADSRITVVNRERMAACADIAACDARRKELERARREAAAERGEPAPVVPFRPRPQ